MALTLKQVQDICLLGGGSGQCRYLAEDEAVDGKFYCLKLVAQQKPEIDAEVDDFVKKHKDRGVDPHSMGMPLGNNCAGYRLLKVKMQGYDIGPQELDVIRILLPRFLYNDERVRLVEKICAFQVKVRPKLQRAYSVLDSLNETFVLEGFLENEDKIKAVARRLSDEPMIVAQGDVDMPTYLIDDGMLAYEIGGS